MKKFLNSKYVIKGFELFERYWDVYLIFTGVSVAASGGDADRYLGAWLCALAFIVFKGRYYNDKTQLEIKVDARLLDYKINWIKHFDQVIEINDNTMKAVNKAMKAYQRIEDEVTTMKPRR